MKPLALPIFATLFAAWLGGCAYPGADLYRSSGPPPMRGEALGSDLFNPADFAWSARPGPDSIVGVLAYRSGPDRYTCAGGDVILTPETPWSRRRMIVLYGSASSAAVPVAIVRARTPSAPSGDYARFVRKTSCDQSSRFAFGDLPDGAWFVITVAKPIDGRGETIAVTRRIETRGGERQVSLY